MDNYYDSVKILSIHNIQEYKPVKIDIEKSTKNSSETYTPLFQSLLKYPGSAQKQWQGRRSSFRRSINSPGNYLWWHGVSEPGFRGEFIDQVGSVWGLVCGSGQVWIVHNWWLKWFRTTEKHFEKIFFGFSIFSIFSIFDIFGFWRGRNNCPCGGWITGAVGELPGLLFWGLGRVMTLPRQLPQRWEQSQQSYPERRDSKRILSTRDNEDNLSSLSRFLRLSVPAKVVLKGFGGLTENVTTLPTAKGAPDHPRCFVSRH